MAASADQMVSLVRKPLSCRPGIAGTVGAAPVAMRMLRVVSRWMTPSWRAISTVQGAAMVAVPRTTSTPIAV